MLNKLFKRDSKGQIREWDIELDVDNGKYRTISGLVEGEKTFSEWTQAVPQNIGKTNETTAVQQAKKECFSMFKKKIKEGYFESMDDIDTGSLIKPMLAHSFDPEVGIGFPVYSQPKLDGIRCLATKDGLFSRKGEKILSCPHIIEELKTLFEKNPNVILDGELYNHSLKDNFGEIQSLIVRKKPSDEDTAETKNMVEYHIYDIILPGNFINRFLEIQNLLLVSGEYKDSKLKVVATQIIATKKDLDDKYE